MWKLKVELLLAVVAVVLMTRTCAAVPYTRSTQEEKYSDLATEMYFEQPVGHLNYINNHMWKERLFLTG